MIGARMKASPEVFVSQNWASPELQSLVQQWLKAPTGHDRLLLLHFAGDLYEFLGERAVPMWPHFMDPCIVSTCSQSPNERQAAAFAVLLAAQLDGFAAQYGAK